MPLIASFGGSIASDAAGAVLKAMAASMVDAVASLAARVSTALDSGAVGSPAVTDELRTMGVIAGFVVTPLLFIATAGAVLRRDGSRLVRAWAAVPLAAVATVAALALVARCCGVVDWMSGQVLGGSASAAVSGLLVKVVPMSVAAGGLAGLFVAALTDLALFALWLELVVRDAGIALVVVFLPLVFAAAVWPPLIGIVRRAVEVLAALIFSKFVVVAALVLGLRLVREAHAADELLGVAVLLLAAFAPMALLRVVPLVEVAAIASLEGRSRQPIQAMRSTAGRARAAVAAVGGAPAALPLEVASMAASRMALGDEPGGQAIDPDHRGTRSHEAPATPEAAAR